MYNENSSKGFTIVELLIVVAIIGILAAVAVPAYFRHILRTHQADAYHNLLDIKAAEEMFYSQYNRYGSFADVGTENFPNLLSFDPGDSVYYSYRFDLVTATSFQARAVGNPPMKDWAGYDLIITDDADPCIDLGGAANPSLGLKKCP